MARENEECAKVGIIGTKVDADALDCPLGHILWFIMAFLYTRPLLLCPAA
jgi:hypothetical protein